MHLRITFRDEEQSGKLIAYLQEKFHDQFKLNTQRKKDDSDAFVVDMSVDPSLFREISQLCKQEKETFAEVTLEIMDI